MFGAISGASGLIAVSNVVIPAFENAPQPQSPPAPPARPESPHVGKPLVASAEQSYIVLGPDSTIEGAGPRTKGSDFYAVKGKFTETGAEGEVYLSR